MATKWQVRCTSVNGLASYVPTTKAKAARDAAELSRTCMEADVVCGGEFFAAFIGGIFVFGAEANGPK
jgi:hypothetical protein